MEKEIILVADDDAGIRKLLKQFLEKEGYYVLLASNGLQAKKIRELVEVDLIIIDLMMPRIDGLEFLKLFKKNDESPPCIIMTAHEIRNRKEIINVADYFMQKPLKDQEIIFNVQKALLGSGVLKKRHLRKGGASTDSFSLIPARMDRLHLYGRTPLFTISENGELISWKDYASEGKASEGQGKEEQCLFYSAENKKEVALADQDYCKTEISNEIKLLNEMLSGRSSLKESTYRIKKINLLLTDTVNNLFSSPENDVLESATDILDILIDYSGVIRHLYQPFLNLDYNTFRHSSNTMILLLNFSIKQKMSFSNTRNFGLGGLLHDIGLSLIDKKILSTIRYGEKKLSDDEFLAYKEHPGESVNILDNMGYKNPIVREAILEHHERCNGKGFPRGITELSELGNLLGIVDNYEMLTGPEKAPIKRFKPVEAIQLIKKDTEHQGVFNEHFLHKFAQSLVGLEVISEKG